MLASRTTQGILSGADDDCQRQYAGSPSLQYIHTPVPERLPVDSLIASTTTGYWGDDLSYVFNCCTSRAAGLGALVAAFGIPIVLLEVSNIVSTTNSIILVSGGTAWR